MSQNPTLGTHKVAVNNYLGNDYNQFKNDLYRLALTNPERYFEIRKNLLKKIEYDAIGGLYDSFYNALIYGKAMDGTALFPIGQTSGGLLSSGTSVNVAPSYPEQLCNKFCLDSAATLQEIVNDLVEMLMPIDYNTLMNKRLGQIGNAKTLGDLEK